MQCVLADTSILSDEQGHNNRMNKTFYVHICKAFTRESNHYVLIRPQRQTQMLPPCTAHCANYKLPINKKMVMQNKTQVMPTGFTALVTSTTYNRFMHALRNTHYFTLFDPARGEDLEVQEHRKELR